MKVVHVSTHDVAGGAARAALRIHRGLEEIGVDSSMLVAVKGSEERAIDSISLDQGLPARLRRWRLRGRMAADWKRYSDSLPSGFERFSDDRTELGSALVQQLPDADIIHLHWIADFLDYAQFFRSVPSSTPLVWTLHDMNPFTGGCHYDDECGRFMRACGACPQLASTDDDDLSRAIWSRKRDALAEVVSKRMHLVTGSRWLREEVASSSLLGRFPVSTFHYGIDTEVFSPRDRDRVRADLGIDPASLVLLFVADSLENRRKGFAHLLAALERLPVRLPVHLVSIGDGRPPITPGRPQIHLERINDDERLANVYSAADLFVIPSLQEAYGQTTLEALACGTPAVGFRAGGICEVIREGETGALVETGDIEGLASAITSLLENSELLCQMRGRCREIAIVEHSLRTEAEHYLSLYESLVPDRRCSSPSRHQP